jgi:DNA replication protein DnaC
MSTEKYTAKRNINAISIDDYATLMKYYGTEIVQKRKPGESFVIDENNREVLYQFYYYLVGSEKFKGDINKGIMLTGGFGTGKTTLINILKSIYERLNNKVMVFISSIELVEIIKNDNPKFENDNAKKYFSYYEKRPMVLDEVGREVNRVVVYGTERYPMHELITLRYNSCGLTFGTSNLNESDLKIHYKEYIGDRLTEMFNFIEVTGKSRRK